MAIPLTFLDRVPFVACAMTFLILGGCSGSKFVPAGGTITLDGAPVAGAAVLFMPEAGGQPVTANTDPQGKYKLVTGDAAGALPGRYRVSVTLQETPNWPADEDGLSGGPPPGAPQPAWIVPERYSRPDTSGLTAEVSREKTDFPFALAKQAPQ